MFNLNYVSAKLDALRSRFVFRPEPVLWGRSYTVLTPWGGIQVCLSPHERTGPSSSQIARPLKQNVRATSAVAH